MSRVVMPASSDASRYRGRWWQTALASCLLLLAPAANAAVNASTLFESLRTLVYQVRIIDIASGDKTAIGSGFRVTADGLVATNFHVVNLLVHEPTKYRLELIGDGATSTTATIVAIDVLHDLAIISDEQKTTRHLTLLVDPLAQGERIYSMGNPRDLGMSIVEGNYNGPVTSSRFERLLFSGSLNAGMSGGPAFNRDGAVIGVNVATGGDQLSFLVPAKHLQTLLEKTRTRASSQDFKIVIAQDLLAEAESYYGERVAQPWPSARFGDLMLPRDLSPSMKCWGHNVDDDDVDFEGFHQHCRSEEYLFIDDDFYTGNFSYSYEWMTTDDLNPLQFYTAVEDRYTHTSQDNAGDKKHVTNHRCVTDFVDLGGTPWKASVCLRRYKQYAGLHDASLVLVSLNANDRAAVIRMAATGIGRQPALGLFGKLMRSIRWAH